MNNWFKTFSINKDTLKTTLLYVLFSETLENVDKLTGLLINTLDFSCIKDFFAPFIQ